MRLTVTALLLAAIAGCDRDASGPENLTPHLGIIAWSDAPTGFEHFENPKPESDWPEDGDYPGPPLIAPDSAPHGEPFEVTVTTVQPDGCWYAGEHETEIDPSTATITVYDYRTDGEVCTTVFGWKSRKIALQFDEPGQVVVRVIGRRIAGQDFGGEEEFVIEKSVVIN